MSTGPFDTFPTSKQLDHLPVIAHALKRLGLRQIIDELVPTDPRSIVSAGECVEVLITTILLGKHTLYRVSDYLAPYDLQVAFGFDDEVETRHFNDERLAKALDHLFLAGGVPKAYTAAMLAAIREYDLSLKRIHADLTTISVHGEYAGGAAPSDPEDPQAIPHVTHGYSKARRPDLKQVLYGLAVTGDGATPIFGRVSSGNRAEPLELRFMLEQVREALPDPRESIFVGDSKLFAGETLALLSAHDLKFVTLLPKSVGLWKRAFDLFRRDQEISPAPALKVKRLRAGEQDEDEDDSEGEQLYHRWCGRSYDLPYEFEFDSSRYSVPIRLVVVESDALKDRKTGPLERRKAREQAALTKLKEKCEAKVYACEEDARKEKARVLKRSVSFHQLRVRVVSSQRPKKRSKRGRPRKEEKPELEKVWGLKLTITEDSEAFARTFSEETHFVLVTNVLVSEGGDREAADRETLETYDGQDNVERCFRWTKHPLEVAPIFLKTERRIAALGIVYVLALMTYALIQRDARARLKSAGTTMPSNKGWSDNPTTEVIFRLFRGINTIRSGGADAVTHVVGLDTEQVRVLDLLGVTALRQPRVQMAPPRVPVPGDRSFKPVPRPKAKGKKRNS